MATMKFLGITCNVLYVDSTAVGANDGSTMGDALTNIPTYLNFSDNTIYLFRRHDTNSITFSDNSTNTTATNVFFIGMPLTTDELYDTLPAEAKGTSWDSDLDVYAKIFITHGAYGIRFSNCENFGAFRIKFTKESNSDQGNASSNLYVNGINKQGNCSITKCRFVTELYEFDDAGFVANMVRGPFTVYIQYFNNTYFNENVYLRNSHTSSSIPYVSISFYFTENVYINNNVFWNASGQSTTTQYIIVGNNCEKTIMNNNIMKLYGQNNSNYHRYNGYYINTPGFIFKQNKIIVDRFQVQPQVSSTASGAYQFLYYHANNNSTGEKHNMEPVVIEDFLVDMRGYNLGISNTPAISIDTRRQNAYTRGDLYSTNAETSIQNISAYFEPQDTISPNDHHHRCFDIIAPGQIVKNINVECESNNANCFALYLKSLYSFEDSYINGRFYCDTVGNVQLDKLSYENAIERNQILLNRNSFIHITDLKLRNDWQSQSWLEVNTLDAHSSYGNGGRTIIDNCNKNVLVDYLNTHRISPHFGVWVNNVNGVTGNRFMSNYYYKMSIWGVSRTSGSSVASLKLVGNISDTRIPLLISPSQLRGVEVIPNTTSGKIKIYIAFANMLSPSLIHKRFNVVVETKVNGFIGGNFSKKSFSSNLEGRIVDDTVSTWSEAGMTHKVVEVPFETSFPSEPLSIRMFYDWYDLNGYMYIDPEIEVI